MTSTKALRQLESTPSSLDGAARVIVLDRGTVVQSGTHSALMAEEALYRRWSSASSSPRRRVADSVARVTPLEA